MSKESDFLEAESALSRVLARYTFWDGDDKIIKDALRILRTEVK